MQHPMIEVDGVMKHRNNSLGQPIHPTDEGIKNFHRWFVGSNSVDEHGRPLVLYHGTSADFDSFDPEKHGENTGKHLVPHSTFVFSDNPSVASTYAIKRIDYDNNPEYKPGGNVKPVYINTKKILKVNAKGYNWDDIMHKNEIVQTNDIFDYAKSKGYNGVVIKNVNDVHKGDKLLSNVYAVFDEKNIKSALGNNGEFSIFSKNISESIEHPMIEVDGVLKHRNNSEGQPIHPTDEGIRNFHRWFGNDSSYVDEHGRPKIAYHGTTKSFAHFKRSSYGFTGPGIYFGDSSDVANSYAGDDVGANVIPVYIRGNAISHKKYSDDYIMKYGWKESEQKAKDDKITGVYDTKYENAINVFDSSDVKSAIGNSGAFAHPTKITESTEHPMISIDGVLRHRNNSEGQPIHPTDEGIRNFHRWFGDSKIVDKHGRPIPYYRGSKNKNAEAYNTSSMIFLSPSPEFVKNYARDGQTFKLYVKSDKPFDASRGNGYVAWKKFQQETNAPSYATSSSDRGALPHWQQEYDLRNWLNNNVDYDSIYFAESDRSHSIAVKNTSQIKSAIGNKGTFSHQTEINESVEHPMIEVDGEMRHRNNSLGQPIHPTDEGIRNFHRWFGNSETVDEHGRPKVYYHGSNYTNPTTGESFSAHRNTLWVSETPDLANQYAEARQDRGANSSVMPFYVRSRKLFDADKLHHTLHTGDFFKAIGAQAPGIDYKDLGDLADKAREGARQEESGPHYSRHDFWHEPHFLFGSEGADAIHSAFRLGGFSGIRSTETVSNFVNGNFVDVPHKTIGVFDPRDVKSVIGNSGNYSSSIHMHEELIAESADGNYVAVKAILPKEVKQIIRSIDLTVEPIKDADLHATLMYSTKTDIPEEKINKALSLGKKEFRGIIKHINKFDSQKDSDKCCIVIEIESNDLRRLHDRLVRIGAIHSHDEFRPHVSIAYGVPVKEADKIMKTLNNKLDGYQIKFSGFIVEPIKD